jgi:hypothetical protein
MFSQEVGKTSKVGHQVEIEGEDRKEGARALTIIPIASHHLG